MPIIVKKFSVNTGEDIFFPGDVVYGLDEETEKQLVGAGIAEYPSVITTEKAPEAATTVLTIDEFKALSAAAQKEELEKLGIEAGGNAETRNQQYANWLEGKTADGNGTDLGGNGPNTGLPV